MLYQKIWNQIIVAGVLTISLWVGFLIARQKPLWLDEIYSQTASIEPLSWRQIWRGEIPEGNNSPLFYSLQKLICQAFQYPNTDLWHGDNMASRLILRISPVVFMSLAITIIIWYFLTAEGIASAGLALILILTSHLVWGYWAEARPYAMIVLGTVWQAVALAKFLNSQTAQPAIGSLAASHYFLALTSALSVIQVTATAIVLWIAGARRVRQILLYAVLPLAIGFFYYAHAIHNKLWFAPYAGPINLILSNISFGRLLAIGIFPVMLLLSAHFLKKPIEKKVLLFTLWTWLILTGYLLLLFYMKINSNAQAMGSAEVSSRYFITLTPVGIMSMLVLSFALLRQARNGWMKWLVWATILAIALPRLTKAFHWAVAWHIWGQ